MSYNKDVAKIFASKIMKDMEEALELVFYSEEYAKERKFDLIKSVASLTSEILATDEINEKMLEF